MNWSTITLKEPITFKDQESWYKIKLVKNIKGTPMAEVERFDSKAMRRVDSLPANVQMTLNHYLPLPQS